MENRSRILSSNQNTTQNGSIFVNLRKISEPERVEIIKKGFQINQQGKISLKKYSEGTQEKNRVYFNSKDILSNTIAYDAPNYIKA